MRGGGWRKDIRQWLDMRRVGSRRYLINREKEGWNVHTYNLHLPGPLRLEHRWNGNGWDLICCVYQVGRSYYVFMGLELAIVEL